MKTTLKNLTFSCIFLLLSITHSTYASDYVFGNWESGLDGWLICSSQWTPDGNAVLTPGVATGATLGSGALKLEQDLTVNNGWSWAITVNVNVGEFQAHEVFELDITRLTSDWTPGTGSYWNAFDFRVNSSTSGLVDIGAGASWWEPNDGNNPITASWDYSSIKESVGSSPSYLQFVFAVNAQGYTNTSGIFYLDNAKLTDAETYPGKASDPHPADNSEQTDFTPLLSWDAGQWAADVNGHELYFGTDSNDVNDANTSTTGIYLGNTTDPNYQITSNLEFGTQYYWRVDEVNDLNATGYWKGDIWQFTIAEPLFDDTPLLHVDGNKIKDPNGNVVVLRGVSLIDLGATESWYGGATEAIDRITNPHDSNGNSPAWYTRIVRIPICPLDSALFDSSPLTFNPADVNDPDNETLYDLLREVVDYCAEKNIYAIIDWHHMDPTYDQLEDTNVFWEFMAPRFADDAHVLFELFNEPGNDGGTDAEKWDSVRQDMQTWVDIVRTYAPNNLILVGTPDYDQILGPVVDNPIDGNNIVYVSHLYPCHWLGIYSSEPQSYYTDHIATCAAEYPVIVTEWGFVYGDPDYSSFFEGTISNYGRGIKTFLEGLGIGNTAWCVSNDVWGSPMFDSDWILRCGENEMGCFTKDWLYEMYADEQDINVTFTKCTVKAGKNQGEDMFIASGTLASSPVFLGSLTEVDVNIVSLTDDELIYTEAIDFASTNLAKGVYKYAYKVAKGEPGAVIALKIDSNKNTLLIKGKNTDLTGLRCPMQINVKIGNYILSGDIDETICNGSKKTIPTRLMRTYEDTLIVSKAKVKDSNVDLADSLAIIGEIAVEDINDSNLAGEEVVVTWDTDTFTVPAGSFKLIKDNKYKCSKISVAEGGFVTALVDLDKCKFKMVIKNATLTTTTGTLDFGISFASFNESDEVTIP